ncbi:uncharacterized protein [Hyperolius riggenbachi]|uniref:uncharacterized protein isoform X4 n=1 Tax=Hyperolius riggenbachi TaxID=752182 RepID=UPI0035A34014
MEPRGEVTWDDVAVHFSEEEWLTLAEWQQKLYKEVMMDNYQTVLSLGIPVVKSEMMSLIERGEDFLLPEAPRQEGLHFMPASNVGLCKRIKKAEELQELEEGSGVSNEPPLDNLEPPAAVTSPSSERGSFTTSLIPPELWRCRRRIYARPLPPSSSKEEELQEVEEGSGVCNEPPVDNLDPPAAVTSPSSEQWSFTTSSLSPLLTALSSLASLSTSTASLSTSTASSSTSTASSSTSTTSSSASITSSSDQQHTALPGQATAPTEQLSSESETDFHFSVASRAAGTARLIKPEKIYIIKTMLQSNYDGLRDLFQKRQIVESLQQELWERFRRRHSVSQIQRRWSDIKRRDRRLLHNVRDQHVPNAQIPPRRHRGRRSHEESHSEESPDHPPPLDLADQADPPDHPEEDYGPLPLRPEPPPAPQELRQDLPLPPHPEEPQPVRADAPLQQQRGSRRARMERIFQQLQNLMASLQEAMLQSDAD